MKQHALFRENRGLSILLITVNVIVHSSLPRDGVARTCLGLEDVL